MKEFIIEENEAGQRFDKYLVKLLKEAPKSFFYKMLRKKNITLNGKKATGNEKLLKGDTIKLFLSDETFDKFAGSTQVARAYCELDIIYEDADIIIINKRRRTITGRIPDRLSPEKRRTHRRTAKNFQTVRVQSSRPKHQRHGLCWQKPRRIAVPIQNLP